ncbi:membrane dipeptidase [Bradyrhizobium sp. B120]|uniref:membrane dipeptidase n=1 Tax=Bradyrhizobium sp. B120 TaxID=3410088 RepID=UPI003B98280E
MIERLNANQNAPTSHIPDTARLWKRLTHQRNGRVLALQSKVHLDPRRSFTDEQARAAARRGGLAGVVACPYFVAAGRRPTLDEFIGHIAHRLGRNRPRRVGSRFLVGRAAFSSDLDADTL